MVSPAVFAALALVIVCGGLLVAVASADRRRASLRRRLEAFSAAGAEVPEAELSLRRQTVERRYTFLTSAMLTRLEHVLAATGHRINLLHLVAITAVAALVTGAFVILIMGLSWELSSSLAAAAGVAAPVWLVRHMQRRFQQQFVDDFPEALDVMVRGVRAGLPMVSAMGVAADEVSGPVGNEIRQSLDQMRIGVDMEVALREAAERIRAADFWFFVVCLTLQRRTGGALAETLANLSSLIRCRKELRVKARALTAESKTSTIILAALPIVVAGLLFLVSGETMTVVFHDPRGRFLLGLAVVLLLIGIGTMVGLVRRVIR